MRSLPLFGPVRVLRPGGNDQSSSALCWPLAIKRPLTKLRKGPLWPGHGSLGPGGLTGVSSSLCAPEQVHAFDKKLEEMSNQVLQWQKQHQCDLKMLAAKEEQLQSFQEEMTTLKENLLADEKDVGAPRLPVTSSPFLPALPTATWLPNSPWWGMEVPGSKERHLLYSAQSRV